MTVRPRHSLFVLSAFVWFSSTSCSSQVDHSTSGTASGTGGSVVGDGTGGAANSGGSSPSGGTGGVSSGGMPSAGGTGGGMSDSGGSAGSGGDVSPEDAHVFILFGEGNMWGEPKPEPQDLAAITALRVLTLVSCDAHQENEWVTALPPLHGCVGHPGTSATDPGVGPGDYFARKVWVSFPTTDVLLIPNAIESGSITEFAVGSPNYEKMMARARIAQELGTIQGILLHHGESDCADPAWPDAVENIVEAMRASLGDTQIPLLVGQIPPSSDCQGHNALVAQLADMMENAHVISAADLEVSDGIHIDLPSMRTFGTRYGDAMVELLGL